MRIARIKESKEPIEAEELKFLNEDDLPEFICADENCAVPLIPASFRKHNKQRPHFRTLKNHDHSSECKYSEFARILELGGKRRITFDEFEDLPVPTRLVKANSGNLEQAVKAKAGEQDEEKTTRARKGTTGDFDESGINHRNVTSISQIVDFYLCCPFNRDIELTIFDKTKEYMYWFKRLKNTLNHDEPIEQHIYFGQIHQDNEVKQDESGNIRIKMYDCEKWERPVDGEYVSVQHEQVNPIYVTIKAAGLSKYKISRIKNEIEFVKNEQLEAFKEDQSDSRKPFIFFVGTRSSLASPFEFEVHNHHLVGRYTEVKLTILK